MMDLQNKTLGELLSDERIAKIQSSAIKGMDLSKEPNYQKTLAELKAEHFGGDLERGFRRLYKAADSGDWFYPLYSGVEIALDPNKRDLSLVWFPSDDPLADERPFVLVIPGGGFVNVWNLTEGWPVADHFNASGYHAFILTYQVGSGRELLNAEMDDIAQALKLIRKNASHFHVNPDAYMTCGFSAGGYLTCLWSTQSKGYATHGLPKPQLMIPVYPLVSIKEIMDDEETDFFSPLFDCPLEEAANSVYEIPEHVEGFPPCAVLLAAQDELVNPKHSLMLKIALDKADIPCRYEVGPVGGHGFADGTGMCMEGWPERVIHWYESGMPRT